MPLGSPFGFVIILRKLQRRRHLLVGQKPVAMRIVQVIGAILEEHANRLWRSFANQRRIYIATAAAGYVWLECDAGKTADLAENFAKLIGPLPGDGKGADSPGARSADGVSFGI